MFLGCLLCAFMLGRWSIGSRTVLPSSGIAENSVTAIPEEPPRRPTPPIPHKVYFCHSLLRGTGAGRLLKFHLDKQCFHLHRNQRVEVSLPSGSPVLEFEVCRDCIRNVVREQASDLDLHLD